MCLKSAARWRQVKLYDVSPRCMKFRFSSCVHMGMAWTSSSGRHTCDIRHQQVYIYISKRKHRQNVRCAWPHIVERDPVGDRRHSSASQCTLPLVARTNTRDAGIEYIKLGDSHRCMTCM